VVVDTSSPAWAYGAIQDHEAHKGKVDLSAGRDKIPAGEWLRAPGGEGSHHAIDPHRPDIVYSQTFYGNFTRDDQSIAPARRGRRDAPGNDEAVAGRGSAPQRSTPIRPPGEGLRSQWMTPVIISPHDARVVYVGFQHVFRSANRGDAWTKISDDLTGNDSKQMLPKSSNEIPYQTISALAESPKRKGLMYAGTDDGRLHVTMDEGKTWTDLTKNVPTQKWYSRIVPSEHAEGTVYITQRGREDDDFAPCIYKSTDYGKTFTRLVNNIPAGPVNVIREDPTNPRVLYVGTDFGAFISTDGGQRWDVLGKLPSVQVSDLWYQPRDHIIVISTYGRGMYAMDANKLRVAR
jgi:hypothetical protein